LSRLLVHRLTPSQVKRKLTAFYATLRLITVFTKSRHWTLFCLKWIQSKSSHIIAMGSIFI
jgi:hypothetical protein